MTNTSVNGNGARIQQLEAAIVTAAAVFRTYERMHLAKGTPDGAAKAKVNADHAQALEAVLRKPANSQT